MSPHSYSIAAIISTSLRGVFRSPGPISPLLLWPLVGPKSSDKPTIEHWDVRFPLSIFTHSTIQTLADVFYDLALNPLALLPLPVALSYPIDTPCPSLSNCPQSYLSYARLGERSSVSKTHANPAAFFPVGPGLDPFSNAVVFCSCATYPAQTL
jgi:hypothetical protein